MAKGRKGKRWAAGGAFVAAGVLAIVAALVPKTTLPDFLQILTSGLGWLIACIILIILGGILTFLSFQPAEVAVDEEYPGLPIYEEMLTDSLGFIRHVTITDSYVAEKYIELRYQKEQREAGTSDD